MDEAAILGDAGIELGERTELTRRCEQFDAWREQEGKVRDARVLEAEKRKALEGEENLIRRADAGEHDVLQQDLDQAKMYAEGLEKLRDELTAIRTRLGGRRRRSSVRRGLGIDRHGPGGAGGQVPRGPVRRCCGSVARYRATGVPQRA